MLNPYDTAREFGHSYRRPGSSMSAITGDDFTMCDASHPNAGQDLRQGHRGRRSRRNRRMARGPAGAGAERRPGRAGYVLENLLAHAASLGLRANGQTRSAYLNTIPADQSRPSPATWRWKSIARINRWNALAMVVRANQAHGELGGHIASMPRPPTCSRWASIISFARRVRTVPATWSTCNRTPPGVYARAYLEGFLNDEDLAHFRQEITARARGLRGLSSLSAPVADAGLLAVSHRLDGNRPDQRHLSGPLHALPEHRSLAPASERKVWGIFGDGEMDEPESIAALTLAAREARQPGVRGQLQPATAGRPGARQRPHHR